MKALVFTYHDIGCVGLKALKKVSFKIQAIFTHIDNPKKNIFFLSVARLGAEMGLPVYAPENVNNLLWIERILKMQPDVIFLFTIAAYLIKSY